MADLATLGIRVDASGAASQLDTFGRNAERAADSGEKLAHVGETLKETLEKLGIALGAIELIHLANEAREAAERFEILGAAAQQMSVTMGVGTEEIIGVEKALRTMGTTMEDSRNTVIKLMNAHIDLSNATALQAEAQNLSIKENISEKEAMDSLILAIQTGMARTLKHAGVVADFTKATQDAAHAMGVQTGQLSTAQVEQIRLTEVLKAGAQIQGVYSAAMQTGAGNVIAANKAMADLRLVAGQLFASLVKDPVEQMAHALSEMAKWAKENPDALEKIKVAIETIAAAVAAAVAAWILWNTAIVAWSAAMKAMAIYEAIGAFLEFNRAVTLAADATALLGLAMDAVNPVALVASLAAVTVGYIAWKKLTSETKDETKKFQEGLNGLGETIKTTGAKAVVGNTGLQSTAEALAKLIELRKEVPAFEAGIHGIADALLSSGKGAADLATQQAALTDALIKGTVGLVGADAKEAAALITRKFAAQSYLDEAKAIREVTNAGQDAIRTATQQQVGAVLVGAEARKATIEFEHQNAVIKAQRDLYGDAQAAAISYADAARDAQLKALKEVEAVQPFQAFLSNTQDAFGNFFGNIVTQGTDAFKSLADTVRSIFGQLIADLAKMFFEKNILPQLASMLGLGGSAQDAASISTLAAAQGAKQNHGFTSGDAQQMVGLQGTQTTASQSTYGKIATGAGIGIAGLSMAYSLGNSNNSALVGGLGGAASGAAAGAAIGTMILPGLGTAIGAIIGTLGGLVAGLIGHSNRLKQAKDDWNKAQGQFIDGLAQFPSSAAQQFSQIETDFQKLVDGAKKIGGDFAVSQAAIDAKNAAEATIRKSFTDSIAHQVNALGGPAGTLSNTIDDITKAYQANVDTLKVLGGTQADYQQASGLFTDSMNAAVKAFNDAAAAARQQTQDDITNLQLRMLNASGLGNSDQAFQLQQSMEMGDYIIKYGLDSVQVALLGIAQKDEAIARKQQQAVDAANKQIALLQTQQQTLQQSLTAQQSTVNATQSLVTSLRSSSDALKLGSLTTLAPYQQLQEARRQLDVLVTSAKGGDQNAAANVGAAVQNFLKASQSYNFSGPGYASDYDYAQNILNSLGDQYQAELDVENQILSVLQSQSDQLAAQILLLQVANQTAIADANQAKAQALLGQLNNGGPGGQELIGQLLAMGYTVNKNFSVDENGMGNPYGPYYLTGGGPGSAQAYADLLAQAHAAWAAAQTPAPGFAGGGDWGGGMMNVGEHGRETLLTGKARVLNASQLAMGSQSVERRLDVIAQKVDAMVGALDRQTQQQRVMNQGRTR